MLFTGLTVLSLMRLWNDPSSAVGFFLKNDEKPDFVPGRSVNTWLAPSIRGFSSDDILLISPV